VADMTDPDWEPIMKRASAIVTNRGGRTCHAAIIARELGIPAVVGTGNATRELADGRPVTVSCAEGDTGFVYDGTLDFTVESTELDTMPDIPVKIMMNVGTPTRRSRSPGCRTPASAWPDSSSSSTGRSAFTPRPSSTSTPSRDRFRPKLPSRSPPIRAPGTTSSPGSPKGWPR
jgi:phosphohistidine swiveling domain-containing protein